MTNEPLFVIIIDNEDFEKVSQYKWYYNLTVDGNGYARHDIQINKRRKLLFLHRFVLDIDEGGYVDHKNGNSLDCRKRNLRFCTNQQNAFNIKSRKKNKMGYKGVYWNRSKTNPYSVQIMLNGDTITIGRFKTKIEAAKAYDAKARELFGEFAKTNF